MRLFHVSEDPDIIAFSPRIPSRKDLDQKIGLVWAIDEARLPNFLTPRDCPRIAYYSDKSTAQADRERFFSSSSVSHAIVIEKSWFHIMQATTLYLYEFDPDDFVLQDDIAGYYVAKTTQFPKNRFVISNLFDELMNRNTEIRITDNLWDIADAVQQSSLSWSLCRMRNAKPRT